MDTTVAGKLNNSRRLVLLPLPLQGHLNPILQLANILHSKGFSITILHTRFNSPNPTNYPHFMFVPIPGAGEENLCFSDVVGQVIRLLNYINTNLVDPIRECLERLMSEDDGVACLITDAQWFGTQSVADGLKVPRIVHRTSNISSFLSFANTASFSDQGRKYHEGYKRIEPETYCFVTKHIRDKSKKEVE